MHLKLRVLLLVLPFAAFGWDRPKAFGYLETRQQQWAAWKPTQKAGGACLSCHTGMSYLLARASSPTLDPQVQGVRIRLSQYPPQITLPDEGAEAVLNLFSLSRQRHDRNDPVSDADRAALRFLWEKQIADGDLRGSWTWVNADLDPMDAENSNYFGTALVLQALSTYPDQPAQRVAAIRNYLRREASKQPLHHRLAWAAFDPKSSDGAATAALRDLWAVQSADGGWTTASLGPWPAREGAPPSSGSSAYATAWAAFAAHASGAVSCSDPRLARALDWLDKRQDPTTGAWNAASMNKVYPAGSMQANFMTDAATGYAVAVLGKCRPE